MVKEFSKCKGKLQKFSEAFVKCLDHFQIRKKKIETLIIGNKFIYFWSHIAEKLKIKLGLLLHALCHVEKFFMKKPVSRNYKSHRCLPSHRMPIYKTVHDRLPLSFH